MGLGKHRGDGASDDVTLARAREKASACRQLVTVGIVPINQRDTEHQTKAGTGVTFRAAFEAYYTVKRESLSNAKHRAQWQSTMGVYVFPSIGDRLVAEVTASEVIAVLTPIWFEKPETAKRVLQRIEAVFKSAIVRGYRKTASPCIGVAQELGTRHRTVTNHRALPYAEVPSFLESLRTCKSWPATRLAFEWLVLTASRSGETRLAKWQEINEQAALWTIPGERMKAKRPHACRCNRVASRSIPRPLRSVFPSEPSDLLLPSSKAGAPLSDMTLTKVLREMGLGDRATVHGFRSSFKVWSAEIARVRDEVSEAALAHVIPEKVRAAYLRTQFLDERKPLMAAWATFCSTPPATRTVIELRQAQLASAELLGYALW
jgi:integrase